MIQDIAPDRMSIAFHAFTPQKGDSVLLFLPDGRMAVRYDEKSAEVCFPVPDDHGSIAGRALYLFSVGEKRYFLQPGQAAQPDGFTFCSLQELRRLPLRSHTPLLVAFTAYHLWQWYRSSRFCGACGARTEADTKERAMVCPACGHRIYPRINPAVIVGVTKGDALLLTRYRRGFAHNALIAGFCEIGETAEDTVRREVEEEVGLRVKNIRYYKSQPWGSAGDLLMGFFCDVDEPADIRLENTELCSAIWTERKKIVLQPDDLSLTNEMMCLFRDGGR